MKPDILKCGDKKEKEPAFFFALKGFATYTHTPF